MTTSLHHRAPWDVAIGEVLGARAWVVGAEHGGRHAFLDASSAPRGHLSSTVCSNEVTLIGRGALDLAGSLHAAQWTTGRAWIPLGASVVSVLLGGPWTVHRDRVHLRLQVQHHVDAACHVTADSVIVFPIGLMPPADRRRRCRDEVYEPWMGRQAGPGSGSRLRTLRFESWAVTGYAGFGGPNVHTSPLAAQQAGLAGLLVPALMIEATVAHDAPAEPLATLRLATRYRRPVITNEKLSFAVSGPDFVIGSPAHPHVTGWMAS